MGQINIENPFIFEALQWFSKKTKDIFLLLDKKGIIKYANSAFETCIQIPNSDIENSLLFDFIHPDDVKNTVEKLLFINPDQQFIPFTSRLKQKNGTYSSVLWTFCEYTEEGSIKLICQPLKDIIDSRDSISIGWRSTFFDLTDTAADIVDVDGKVILVNRAFEELYGWTQDELTGKRLPIIPQHLEFEFQNVMQRLLQGEKIIKQQTVRQKRDGTLIPINLMITPVYNENCEISALLGVTENISELMEYKMLVKLQNETLEAEERLLLDITKNISEVICLFDIKKDKFLYVSPSIEKSWGIKLEDIYENPLCFEEKFDTDASNNLIEIFRSTSGISQALEFNLTDKDSGQTRWIRAEITPITDKDGTVTRHISIFKDVTELKEKTNQIKQLDQLGVIGQLAAGIAHEIRNPLTSIKGFVQLLAEETNHQFGEIITSEIERIEFIMNEFLILAKPQREIVFKKENVNTVVQEVISFMRPEAVLNNVEFVTKFNSFPYVNCEAKQIKQVIINLIKNAIEAMPRGGKLHIHTLSTEEGFVMIKVRDEGIGISKEHLQRLSEPFFTNKEKGTGLGLMISNKIIEDHKGSIEFFSELGKGTTVEIRLPLATDIGK